MAEVFGVPEVHSDDEWHPRDPAKTTPQLLSGLWHQITQAGSMAKGVRSNNNVMVCIYTFVPLTLCHELTNYIGILYSRLSGHGRQV